MDPPSESVPPSTSSPIVTNEKSDMELLDQPENNVTDMEPPEVHITGMEIPRTSEQSMNAEASNILNIVPRRRPRTRCQEDLITVTTDWENVVAA